MKSRLHYSFIALGLLVLSTLNTQLSTVYAQGTAFTYNGKLNDGGSPANGSYDLSFTLYDAVTNGIEFGAVTNAATAVTNGLFTVTLDFGGVFNGSNYWLEIGVRTNGGGSFATLAPRQPILPTPYALYAPNAGNAAYAVSAGTATSAANNNFTGVNTFSGTLNANNLYLPATTTNTGIIYLDGSPFVYGGTTSLFAGYLAGNFTSSVTQLGTSWNVGLGDHALASVTTGYSDTAVGSQALQYNTTGYRNTAIGRWALIYNTTGSGNTANGFEVLQNNNSGSYNIAIGFQALHENTSGNYNTANGYHALYFNTSGSENTADGRAALYGNTSGSKNTADGEYSLNSLTDGSGNIALGYMAGYNLTGSESGNIDIGNLGVAGENNIIRLGSGQTQAFIAGRIVGDGSGLTNISVSAISGGVNTNILIGSVTFYITNGIIMKIQ